MHPKGERLLEKGLDSHWQSVLGRFGTKPSAPPNLEQHNHQSHG